MNPLPLEQPEKDKVVIVGQKEIEKKQELIGKIQPQKGHSIFEIHLKKKTIELATFEENLIMYPKAKPKAIGLGILKKDDGTKQLVMQGLQPTSRKIIIKPDCIYVSALNKKNVVKKLLKAGILKVRNEVEN